MSSLNPDDVAITITGDDAAFIALCLEGFFYGKISVPLGYVL